MEICILIPLKIKYRINGKVKWKDSDVIKLSEEFRAFLKEQGITFNK